MPGVPRVPCSLGLPNILSALESPALMLQEPEDACEGEVGSLVSLGFSLPCGPDSLALYCPVPPRTAECPLPGTLFHTKNMHGSCVCLCPLLNRVHL